MSINEIQDITNEINKIQQEFVKLDEKIKNIVENNKAPNIAKSLIYNDLSNIKYGMRDAIQDLNYFYDPNSDLTKFYEDDIREEQEKKRKFHKQQNRQNPNRVCWERGD